MKAGRKPMHKKPTNQKPRLVNVRDCRGNDLTPPRLAQELIDGDRAAFQARATTVRDDLQATRRRPLDAPMETREPERAHPNTEYQLDDVVPPLGIGRAVLTLLLMAIGFVAGLVVGRMA